MNRCGDMESILYRIEGGAIVEGEETFNYLGRTLDQTDDECPVVIQNIKRDQKVWGRLGELLIG